jgi:hypothetical protein
MVEEPNRPANLERRGEFRVDVDPGLATRSGMA